MPSKIRTFSIILIKIEQFIYVVLDSPGCFIVDLQKQVYQLMYKSLQIREVLLIVNKAPYVFTITNCTDTQHFRSSESFSRVREVLSIGAFNHRSRHHHRDHPCSNADNTVDRRIRTRSRAVIERLDQGRPRSTSSCP